MAGLPRQEKLDAIVAATWSGRTLMALSSVCIQDRRNCGCGLIRYVFLAVSPGRFGSDVPYSITDGD
jgi:hypothetical protein